MAEELTEILEKSVLSSKERKEAEIEIADVRSSLKECQRSLIGKVVGEKKANFNGIKKFVSNAWGNPKKLKLVEVGTNMFQFYFENETEMERILNGGPWIFDNQLMIIQRWQEGMEEDEKAFLTATFWVQVWNLPLHWFSKEIGWKIGAVFEGVKEVIIPLTGSREGRYMKMLVDIDVTQPIIRGTMAKHNGATRWIQFRYERMPDFCYNCGLIGHSDRSCFKRSKGETKEQGQQFGDWLKVRGAKNVINKDKSVVNYDHFSQIRNKNSKGGENENERETQNQVGDVSGKSIGDGDGIEQIQILQEMSQKCNEDKRRENLNSEVGKVEGKKHDKTDKPEVDIGGQEHRQQEGEGGTVVLSVGPEEPRVSKSTKVADAESENKRKEQEGPQEKVSEGNQLTLEKDKEREGHQPEHLDVMEEDNQQKFRRYRKLKGRDRIPLKEINTNEINEMSQGKRKWEDRMEVDEENKEEKHMVKRSHWMLLTSSLNNKQVEEVFVEKPPGEQ